MQVRDRGARRAVRRTLLGGYRSSGGVRGHLQRRVVCSCIVWATAATITTTAATTGPVPPSPRRRRRVAGGPRANRLRLGARGGKRARCVRVPFSAHRHRIGRLAAICALVDAVADSNGASSTDRVCVVSAGEVRRGAAGGAAAGATRRLEPQLREGLAAMDKARRVSRRARVGRITRLRRCPELASSQPTQLARWSAAHRLEVRIKRAQGRLATRLAVVRQLLASHGRLVQMLPLRRRRLGDRLRLDRLMKQSDRLVILQRDWLRRRRLLQPLHLHMMRSVLRSVRRRNVRQQAPCARVGRPGVSGRIAVRKRRVHAAVMGGRPAVAVRR
jgi:hypothetical protein